jgi:hypothetical protein
MRSYLLISLNFLLASDLRSQKPVETGVGAGGFLGMVLALLLRQHLEPLAIDERKQRPRGSAGATFAAFPLADQSCRDVEVARQDCLTDFSLSRRAWISLGDKSWTSARQSSSNLRIVILSMTPALCASAAASCTTRAILLLCLVAIALYLDPGASFDQIANLLRVVAQNLTVPARRL